jgi:hypothetical protein
MSQTTAVEPTISVAAVRKALADTNLSLAGVLTALALAPEAPVVEQGQPAPPAPITDDLRKAVAKLPEVFGSVVPNKVRALTPSERVALIEERETIDVILSTLKSRKDEGIRETLANDVDQRIETTLPEAELATLAKDETGHYLHEQYIPVPDKSVRIAREIRVGSPTISQEKLLEAFEEGKLSREEYLACTREVRVFDETKARKAIERNPELLAKLAEYATEPGKSVGAIYIRKGLEPKAKKA